MSQRVTTRSLLREGPEHLFMPTRAI